MKRKASGLLAVLLAVMVFTACSQEPTIDVEKYKDYICYDSLLACTSDISEVAGKRMTSEGDNLHFFSYCYTPNVPDDNFILTTIRQYLELNDPKNFSYLLQNPENYVDVWTDWTIKEIQVFYCRGGQSSGYSEEAPRCRIPTEILATTSDPNCIQEILRFITSDEFGNHGVDKHEEKHNLELYSADFDGRGDVEAHVTVRVIFNESDYIVWDSDLEGYRDFDTLRLYFMMEKDNTTWDATDYHYGIGKQSCWVENLPALEAFLTEAADALWAKEFG